MLILWKDSELNLISGHLSKIQHRFIDKLAVSLFSIYYVTMSSSTNSQTIIFVGVARNVEKTLAQTISILDSIGSHFREYYFFIVESDSNDYTLNVLQKLKLAKQNFHYHSLGKLEEKIPERTSRIAYCRNEYLKYIFGLEKKLIIDYVAVVDLDGVNLLLNSESFLSCWNRYDWDACFANQEGPYYDIWALRHPTWCPGDCWIEERGLRRQGFSPRVARKRAIFSKMVILGARTDWIQVESAFGGLGIYRYASLVGKEYRGTDEFGNSTCEHVSVNQEISKNGGRLFINPLMINDGWNEHTKVLSLKDKIAKLVARILHA